ncbi:hypothetical protein FRZ67_05215 [Panacibacter ginsenosidivorans]|uniref:Uncharacterized protein n=1 Tax=Panacibacter ginsenosidivorans TaxID=1813871 RepID=A0A5B8V5Q4_9BACT|nr:hypothetical protein [Panacibacter ginsenosidivorans]QEC66730.1 hypothetical protein FRZ67_05215 [Panacibacter ginsenosidivorans]
MKKSFLILSAFSACVFSVSCKKESSQPGVSADIQGTWNFQSMDVTSSSTQEYTESGVSTKTVTTSDYTTSNNTGTIVIDGSSMTSSNISYSVSTVAHASIYSNGVLIDNSDLPFNFTAPASSGTATYTSVSADSIHFNGGSLFMSGVATDVTPSGAKLDLQGDILSMTQYVNQTATQEVYGVPITTTTYAKVIAKLKKQ